MKKKVGEIGKSSSNEKKQEKKGKVAVMEKAVIEKLSVIEIRSSNRKQQQ